MTGSGADRDVRTIALQADGKVLIGGLFNTYNGVQQKGIARLNVDGSLDTTFDTGSGPNDGVNKILVQPGCYTSGDENCIRFLRRFKRQSMV